MKRIENAEKLLVDPTTSVTEVAIHSGYSSLPAFVRMFKQIKGCTPTEFRKMRAR
jgi:AraC-like DNA-binding protein